MTIHEKDPRFTLFGRNFGTKPGKEITSTDEPMLVKEEFVGNTLRASLRASGRGEWHGLHIKVVNGDTVIFGQGAANMGVKATLKKEEINNHPLLSQVIVWKP